MLRNHPVLAAVLLGGALFAASEVGLRLLTDRDSMWNVRLGAHKQFDPVTFFRNKPNYDFGNGVVTNEYGYQAPRDLARANPPDALRLIYLGDSNTVTPLKENYPYQVERILEPALGVDVQTLNTAVPGFASENAWKLFRHEVSEFRGDYLFVYLGWNDLGQFGPEGLPYKLHRTGYELSPLQRALTRVYTLRFLYAFQRVWRRGQPAVAEPMGPEDRALYERYRPDHFYDNLRSILRLGQQVYPHVYVMTLATITNEDPTPSELARAHFPTGMDKNMRKLHHLVQTYNQAVREVAAELDVPIIDLYAMFDSHEAREVFKDSCHMTPAGAGRIARALADEILAREAERPSLGAASAGLRTPPRP